MLMTMVKSDKDEEKDDTYNYAALRLGGYYAYTEQLETLLAFNGTDQPCHPNNSGPHEKQINERGGDGEQWATTQLMFVNLT